MVGVFKAYLPCNLKYAKSRLLQQLRRFFQLDLHDIAMKGTLKNTCMKIISECLGLIGIILNVIIYQQKKRKNLLVWKLISDVDWALHYAIAGNFSGAAVGTIGIARESIFLAIEGKKSTDGPFWLCSLSAPASRCG